MSILKSLLGSLGSSVVGFLDNRSQRKHEQKTQVLELEKLRHEKQIELIQNGQELDNAWELQQLRMERRVCPSAPQYPFNNVLHTKYAVVCRRRLWGAI